MQRLRCLDGLRGVLALYVLLGHMAPFMDLPAGLAWLPRLLSHGMAAVDMFFILSGLVIAQSLEAFGHRAAPFLAARAARIFPTYLVVLAAAAWVEGLPPGYDAMPWIGAGGRDIWPLGSPADWPAHVAAHLTMTHGLLPDAVLPFAWISLLGAAWSLSTEWQFYALVALIGARLRRPALLFLAIALAGATWAAAAPPGWEFSRAFLPNKAQYFALGVASAALVRQGRRGLGQYALVLAGTLAIGLLRDPGLDKALPPLAWTLCLAAQLRPRTVPGLARALTARPALWLGAVSYPLYLVNEPAQKLLGVALAWAAGGSGAAFTLGWIPGAILIPIGLAWWLHRHVELPGMRWGRAAARRSVVSAG